jgi:toxin FitB
VSFLVDTSVISEVRKGKRCHPRVAAWYESIDDADLYLSVLILGEIRTGIELARSRDSEQVARLESWLERVVTMFGDRILIVDQAVAEAWGRMNAVRPLPVVDSLLAATAKVNRMTFVTRNDADVQSVGATVLNPFKA